MVDRLIELTMENVPVATDFTMASRPVTTASTILELAAGSCGGGRQT